MAKVMKRTAVFSIVLTILFGILNMKYEDGVWLPIAITFGTISYHLWMRLAVGELYDRILQNHVNYSRKWFQVSQRELRLYEKLKVKKWKSQMPTYDSTAFDPRRHTWDEIAQAMCQSELVHETIILLSFVPILASIWFGALPVFVITSILSAGYDGMFVMMQRYNRPRIIGMIKGKR